MLREIWTEDALSDVEEILDYISDNWTRQIIERFYSELTTALNRIKERPQIFQYFDKEKGIRSCLPNQHFRLFYKVIEDDLHILRLFPNRKDPDKLFFRL